MMTFIFAIAIILVTPLSSILTEYHLLYLNYLDEALVVVFAAANILMILIGRKAVKCPRVIALFSMLLLLAFISALYNDVRPIVVLAQVRYIFQFPLIFFIIASSGMGEKHIRRITSFILSAAVVVAFLTFVEFFWHVQFLPGREAMSSAFESRMYSIIGGPVDLAYYLGISIILGGLYLVNIKRSIYTIGAYLLVVFAVLSSGSRGAMITILLALSYYFMTMKGKMKAQSRRVLYPLMGSVIFVAIIAVGLVFVPVTVERFRNLLMFDPSERFSRANYLGEALNLIRLNPLLGVGPGMYGGPVSVFFNSDVYAKYSLTVPIGTSIDMFWPHFTAELGVFGAAVYGMIFIVLARLNGRIEGGGDRVAYRNFLSESSRILIFYMLVSGFFYVGLQAQLSAYLFWMILGLSYRETELILSEGHRT
ncbi:MAG: O-antigen ligase family protein [Candidatus Omnitrophica bacterium]|nr:O-antigen ligase family protein [Candidatus Omnitrophota bacterium]